jgi:hypothetical protein
MGNKDQLKAASTGSDVHEGESQEKQRKHYDIGTEGLAGSAEVGRVQIKLNSDFSISLQTFLVQDTETDASHRQEYLTQQSGTSTEGMRYKRPLKTLFLSPLPHYLFTPKTIPIPGNLQFLSMTSHVPSDLDNLASAGTGPASHYSRCHEPRDTVERALATFCYSQWSHCADESGT